MTAPRKTPKPADIATSTEASISKQDKQRYRRRIKRAIERLYIDNPPPGVIGDPWYIVVVGSRGWSYHPTVAADNQKHDETVIKYLRGIADNIERTGTHPLTGGGAK